MVEGIKLENTVTGKVIAIDMLTTLDYILESVSWGTIEGTHHTYKFVNQVGETLTDTSLGTRDVQITGWVIADNELLMTQRKRVLNQFVNPQQPIILYYKDYKLKFSPDNSIAYADKSPDNNEVICKFTISGLATDPLFTETNDSTVAAATTAGKFHFPLIISKTPDPPGGVIFGLREPSLIVNVINNGSVSTGMIITFKAKGTMKNPSLINVETQEYIKINKEFVAGEEVVINTTIGEKSITGYLNGLTYNYYKYRDFDSSWLQLDIGDNLFRYYADENLDNLDVLITYQNKYLEVQQCR